MSDVFKEQLVKKKPNAKDLALKGAAVLIAVVIVGVFILFLPSFLPFGVLGVGFGLYYVFGMFNVEYEYAVTNGELDIDCIYAKSRRKRIFTGELKGVEIMCHVSDRGYDSMFRSATEKKDCSTGEETPNTYMFLTTYKGKKLQITFAPNDELLNAMSPYLGQRKLVRKNKNKDFIKNKEWLENAKKPGVCRTMVP